MIIHSSLTVNIVLTYNFSIMESKRKKLKFLVLECSDLLVYPSPVRPFKVLYSSGRPLLSIFLKYDEIFCNTIESRINKKDIVLDNFVESDDFIIRQIFFKKKNGVVCDFTLKLFVEEVYYKSI